MYKLKLNFTKALFGSLDDKICADILSGQPKISQPYQSNYASLGLHEIAVAIDAPTLFYLVEQSEQLGLSVSTVARIAVYEAVETSTM